MTLLELIDRVRVEAHTGVNRCIPCTIVNAVLAIGLSVIVTMTLLKTGRSVALGGGASILLAASALIYLRGYVIPGTPWFTGRYLPERILDLFDGSRVNHATIDTTHVDAVPADTSSGLDVEPLLKGGGVLEDCRTEDDLCLTAEFRSSWWDRMEEIEEHGDLTARAAGFLGVEPGGLSVTDADGSVILHEDRRPKGKWESRPALIADLAADRELERRIDGWASLDVHRRSSVLQGVRVFLDRCPSCSGHVTADWTEVDSCCRASTVVAVSCDDCLRRIAEIDQVG